MMGSKEFLILNYFRSAFIPSVPTFHYSMCDAKSTASINIYNFNKL